MKDLSYQKHVVDYAYEIIEMHNQITELLVENENLREYQRLYIELLNSSIQHNETMMVNVLQAALDGENMTT